MPGMWRNKMIERGFNYAGSTIKEMTDVFQNKIVNLEPKEDKKKSSAAAKKSKDDKCKKRKRTDSNINVIESSKETSV